MTSALPIDPKQLSREDRVLLRATKDRLLLMLLDKCGGAQTCTPEALDAYAGHTLLLEQDAAAGCLRFRMLSCEDLEAERAYKAAKG